MLLFWCLAHHLGVNKPSAYLFVFEINCFAHFLCIIKWIVSHSVGFFTHCSYRFTSFDSVIIIIFESPLQIKFELSAFLRCASVIRWSSSSRSIPVQLSLCVCVCFCVCARQCKNIHRSIYFWPFRDHKWIGPKATKKKQQCLKQHNDTKNKNLFSHFTCYDIRQAAV